MNRNVPGGPGDGVPDGSRAGAAAHSARAIRGAVSAAALASVVLAGCGGGGGGSSSAAARSVTASTGSSTATQTTSGGAGDAKGLSPALGSSSAVRLAVEAVLASTDPAQSCGRYVTERYLNVAFGGKQGCVHAQQPGSAARSLSAFRIEREGGQGTVVSASAVPDGGPYDGIRVGIGLVFDSDHYRVDQLHSNIPVGP